MSPRKSRPGLRKSSRSSWWVWLAMLLSGTVAGGAPAAEAASLQLAWTGPSTNADGTALTDLAGYRVYLGTSVPPCPSPSFHSVASGNPAPTVGEALAYRVASLAAGTTYFTVVTAVDFAGNESACTSPVSGVAQPELTVNPGAGVSLGSTAAGTAIETTFTVQNPTGWSVTGTATVGSPFSIVSGGAFTLAPGASQVVVVRFLSPSAGSFASNVTFTAGGDTVSRTISAVATGTASTATLVVTKAGNGFGTVTSAPGGISCGADCVETVTPGSGFTLTAAAASGSTFAGWSGGGCSGTATCTVALSASTTVTATFHASGVTSAPDPAVSGLSPSSAAAGSQSFTLTVNGSNFVASSVVRWNGADRSTTFVSPNQLRAVVPAADVTAPGWMAVSVFTPAPGGGQSSPRTFTVTAVPTSGEIIIDNAPAGVQDTAGGRTFTGTWCWADVSWEMGKDALRSCGRGGDTYRWTPNLAVGGTYEVYVWQPRKVNHSLASFTVAHANGATTRLFNQRKGSGVWVLHGRYTFNAGTAGFVEVSDDFGKVIADAVRFVPVNLGPGSQLAIRPTAR